jgi:peroxiredoxin
MTELGEFVGHQSELKQLDVQVLGVSVDPPDKAKFAADKLKAPFPILSDSEHVAMDLYGTRSPVYHTRDGGDLNTPTLFLMDGTGTVRWIHQAPYYKTRAPISQVLEEAGKLQGK